MRVPKELFIRGRFARQTLPQHQKDRWHGGSDNVRAFAEIVGHRNLVFRSDHVLHGLSLQVKEKEIFAVLGPNGAGKTTLLRTIAGLLKDQPKKGIIEFGGKRVQRLAPERIES